VVEGQCLREEKETAVHR